MNKDLFIGPIIEQKVKESQYSVDMFSQEICLSRKSVYNLFKKKSIDTELLCQISKLLQYDFLKLYCSISSNNAEDCDEVKT